MLFSSGIRVLGEEVRAELVTFLEGQEDLRRTAVEPGEGAPYLYGPLLAPTLIEPEGPAPGQYFEQARSWIEVLAGGLDPAQVLTPIHAELSRLLERPVVVPPRHAPFSVRVFPPGTSSPWHTDNYRTISAYSELRRRTADDGQMSWIVPLTPYEGGAIEIPERRVELSPAPGELLLFDGSRLRHRIAEVRGAAPRWTLGGFAAVARDGACVYAWS